MIEANNQGKLLLMVLSPIAVHTIKVFSPVSIQQSNFLWEICLSKHTYIEGTTRPYRDDIISWLWYCIILLTTSIGQIINTGQIYDILENQAQGTINETNVYATFRGISRVTYQHVWTVHTLSWYGARCTTTGYIMSSWPVD